MVEWMWWSSVIFVVQICIVWIENVKYMRMQHPCSVGNHILNSCDLLNKYQHSWPCNILLMMHRLVGSMRVLPHVDHAAMCIWLIRVICCCLRLQMMIEKQCWGLRVWCCFPCPFLSSRDRTVVAVVLIWGWRSGWVDCRVQLVALLHVWRCWGWKVKDCFDARGVWMWESESIEFVGCQAWCCSSITIAFCSRSPYYVIRCLDKI